MTVIDFFDCSSADRQQIGRLFEHKKVRYLKEPISIENINPNATVISVFVNSQVTSQLMDLMPRLKLIAVRATGYNNVDLVAAKKRHIKVANVPVYGDHTVAEYTFGLMIDLTRKITESVEAAKNGLPAKRGNDLAGKTLGVIGTGRIGQRVIRAARAFDMKVIAYDPYPNKPAAKELGFNYVTLDSLLKNSHIITLHAPYTSANHHMLSKTELSKVRKGALIINTARGELIDNIALVESLERKHLGGVALDVLEGEKLIQAGEEYHLLRAKDLDPVQLEFSLEISTLLKMPNVIVTQHNAYNSIEAIHRINLTTVENVVKFLKGKPTNIVEMPPLTMGKLIIVRHGESQWNALGKWTGSTNVHLTEKGFHESLLLGKQVADIPINYAYCAEQYRSLETLQGILTISDKLSVPISETAALNERDYGDYTGKNKWEMKKQVGTRKFNKIRRDWDYPVPNGETLKTVYARTVPFYLENVLPKLRQGQNVLLVASGNSIRSLVKYIQKISDRGFAKVEMIFGKIVIYDVDDAGHMISSQERSIDTTPPPA